MANESLPGIKWKPIGNQGIEFAHVGDEAVTIRVVRTSGGWDALVNDDYVGEDYPTIEDAKAAAIARVRGIAQMILDETGGV